MAVIKISLPTYKKDKWNNLVQSGEISISSVSTSNESLTEVYQALKVEVTQLLEFTNSENRILSDHQELLEETKRVQKNLMRFKNRVASYESQLRRLTSFFDRIGINGSDSYLRIYEESSALSQLRSADILEDDQDQEGYEEIPAF